MEAHNRVSSESAKLPLGFGATREDLVSLALMAAATLIFFWPLFAGDVLFFRDIGVEIVPKRAWWSQAGLQFLWNPAIFFGMPTAANMQTGALYPFNVFFLAGDVPHALSGYVIFHFFAAMAGTYGLLRSMKASAAAALAGALALAFGGPMVSLGNQIVVLNSAAWIMPMLWSMSVWAQSREKAFAVLAGLFWGLMVFGGEPEIAYLSGIVLVVFLLGLKAGDGAEGFAWKDAITATCVALLVAVLFSAAQWAITLEFTGYSNRSGGLPYEEALKWSLEPRTLVSLLFPSRIGDPGGDLYWVLGFRNSKLPYLLSVYPGLAVMLTAMAGFGALYLSRRREGHPPWREIVFAGGALLFLLLSLGETGKVYWLFHKALPGFDRFRIPERCMVIFSVFLVLVLAPSFDALSAALSRRIARASEGRARDAPAFGVLSGAAFLALLAALTIDPAAPSGPEQYLAYHKKLLWIAAGGAVSAAALGASFFGYLSARPRFSKWAGHGLCLAIFLDLFAANGHVMPTTGPEFHDARGHLASGLPGGGAGRRLAVIRSDDPGRNSLGVGEDPAESFRQRRLDLDPFTGLELGVRDVLAHSSFYPADLDAWLGLAEAAGKGAAGRGVMERALALAGVSYALQPGSKPIKVPDPLPRAYVVPEARWVKDRAAALEAVADPGFDPRSEVILVGEGEGPGPAGPKGLFWPMEITADENHYIELQLDRRHPGYVVLLDWDYPGWEARVNGKPAEILSANGFFRAVEVGSEGGTVEFIYRPTTFYAGLGVSLFCLVLSASYILRSLRAMRADGGLAENRGLWPAVLLFGIAAIIPPAWEGGTTFAPVTALRVLVLLMALVWAFGQKPGGVLRRSPVDLYIAGFWMLSSLMLVKREAYHFISFYWWLNISAMVVLFYVLLQVLGGDSEGARRRSRAALFILLAGALFESSWALLQALRVFQLELGGVSIPGFRASAGYVNPGMLVGSVAPLIPAALALMFNGARRGGPRGRAFVFWSLAALVMTLGMAATGSKSFPALLLPLPIFLVPELASFLASRGAAKRAAWANSSLISAAALALLVAGLLTVPNPIKTRVFHMSDDPYSLERVNIWASGLEMIRDNPLGVGLGSFKYVSNKYRFPVEGVMAGRYERRPMTAHNEYIHLGAETSVLGPLLLVLAAGTIFFRARRPLFDIGGRGDGSATLVRGLAAGLAAIAAHSLFDSNLHNPSICLIAVSLAALLLCETDRSRGDVLAVFETGRPELQGLRTLIAAAVVLGIGASLYLGWSFSLSRRAMEEDDIALRINRLSAHAPDALGNAGHFKSLAASYYMAFQASGDAKSLENALKAASHASELNPLDPEPLKMEGQYLLSFYQISGEEEFGRRSIPKLERAYEMSPGDIDICIARAWAARLSGDLDSETLWWRRAIDLEPHDLMSHVRLARALLKQGKADEAEARFEEYVRRRRETDNRQKEWARAFETVYRSKRVWVDQSEVMLLAEELKAARGEDIPGADRSDGGPGKEEAP